MTRSRRQDYHQAPHDSGHAGAGYSAAHIRLGIEYFLNPPPATQTSGQLFYNYTPYIYPHPLVSGDPGSTPTPQPSASPAPSATPQPTATPAPSASPTPFGLSFNSTDGSITAPFVVNGDNTISQSVETADPSQGGEAVYFFTINTPGSYMITANVNCPDDGSNSFFFNVDGEPTSGMVWPVGLTSGLEPRTVSFGANLLPQMWQLSAGTHQLFVRGREAGAKLGRITISAALPPPTNLRLSGP